jgi:hypothetical protein
MDDWCDLESGLGFRDERFTWNGHNGHAVLCTCAGVYTKCHENCGKHVSKKLGAHRVTCGCI